MLIELSELNIKLLIPLIFPVFKNIENVVKKLYLTEDGGMFSFFRYFCSYNFAIIFVLIIHYRSKNRKKLISSSESLKINEDNENNEENEEENDKQFLTERHISVVETLEKKNIKCRKIKSFIFLVFLCANGLFCYIYRILFEDRKNYIIYQQSIGVFFYIGFIILLSYFILKQKLYKHNFISMGIIAFILLILFIVSVFHKIDGIIILKSSAYYFFYALIFSLYDVLGKKYMITFHHTPYFIMTIIGVVNTILLIIFDIFAYNYNRDISGVIIAFQKNINSTLNFFGLFFNLIIEFITNLGIWLTIYYFTPCHYFISEYISYFINFVISYIQSTNEFYSLANLIIYSIAYIINFICILVFNEVIILNFCSLDFNTKKRILKRLKKDESDLSNVKNLMDIDSENNEDNSSFE